MVVVVVRLTVTALSEVRRGGGRAWRTGGNRGHDNVIPVLLTMNVT